MLLDEDVHRIKDAKHQRHNDCRNDEENSHFNRIESLKKMNA